MGVSREFQGRKFDDKYVCLSLGTTALKRSYGKALRVISRPVEDRVIDFLWSVDEIQLRIFPCSIQSDLGGRLYAKLAYQWPRLAYTLVCPERQIFLGEAGAERPRQKQEKQR